MKRIFVLGMSFCVLFSLCGCTEPARQGGTAPASTASEKQETVISESEQLNPDTGEAILSHSKISKTLSPGVVIEADVTAPKKESLSTYTGAMRIFSVNSVNEVAAALGLSPEEALISQTDYAKDSLIPGDRVYLQFEDNSELICGMNDLWYTTDTFLKMRDILITEGSERNTDLFLSGNNLDFATIEQARGKIDVLLEQLDISVVNEPLCCTLDFETVTAENERQYTLALEEAKDFGQTFTPEKLSITADDACYMFYYPIAVDGMPVSNRMSGGFEDGSWVSGTELVVCYDQDGIAGLSLDYQPVVRDKTNAQPILSLEEILNTVEAKYNSLILEGEYLIYDIRLEYIARPVIETENTYSLIPVWRFSIEHSFEKNKGDEAGTSQHFTDIIYNLFDAITGEELPTDLGGA